MLCRKHAPPDVLTAAGHLIAPRRRPRATVATSSSSAAQSDRRITAQHSAKQAARGRARAWQV